jgi:hypothetical protein
MMRIALILIVLSLGGLSSSSVSLSSLSITSPALGSLSAPAPASVRVGVFGLFHPRELVLRSGSQIALRTDRDTCVLDGREEAQVSVTAGAMHVACGGAVLGTRTLRITGRDGGPADVEMTVPARISRKFRGQVDIASAGEELVPVVSMDLETAVASVVAAEQVASTPLEALKAQAVAARSYFVAARGRHRGFDFCDTTHCQFLREPPAPADPSARAAEETAGLVLAFRGAPIAALYSASCGGRTRSLADAGLSSTGGYPYFSVECSYCIRHATEWDSRLQVDAETQRLEADRSEDARKGHGIGLCQAGAAALARDGTPFADILAHYYPGTTLAMLR